MSSVVLLDLDECLGEFGVTSAFFQLMVSSIDTKQPFTQDNICFLSNHLIRNCLRPGILLFLEILYNNRDSVRTILFTNHENPDFLPFLERCFNYLITSSTNFNKIKFFSEWVTRNDARRKTSPKKNISEILPLLPNHKKIQRTVMFDDTIHKIISDKTRDTIIEVPEYDTEVTYEMLQNCWDTIIKTPFYSLKQLIDMDEDFECLQKGSVSNSERIQQESITEEFMTRPLIDWLLDSSAGDTYA